MKGICLICGERMQTRLCSCGFDASKNYDCYRTIGKIDIKVMSTYIKHRNYEKKLIDSAVKKAMENVAQITQSSTVNVVHDEGKAELEKGRQFYMGSGVQKDYVRAYNCFISAAKKGNAQAMNYIGDLYYFGDGVSKNLVIAKDWYKKAASLGNEDARRNMEKRFGTIVPNLVTRASLADENKPTSAGVSVANSAERKKAEAKRLVDEGRSYYLAPIPLYQSKDAYYKKAFTCFKKAADYDDASAMNYLGDMYYFGDGVSKNYDEAKVWYKKAGLRGNVDAKQNLKKRFGEII